MSSQDSQSSPEERATTRLKLRALDEADLEVCSAVLQEAVVKVGDLTFLPGARRVAALFNRFCWESADDSLCRVRTGMHIENVMRVQTRYITQTDPNAALVLLAMRYVENTNGNGIIELIFSDGGIMRLEVECIDVYLDDVSHPWSVEASPGSAMRQGDTQSDADA